MTRNDKLPTRGESKAVNTFLQTVSQMPVVKHDGERGRLIVAIDATASRQPTWDQACQLQGDMFKEAAGLGGLEIQLCFYRGYAEFSFSPWYATSAELLKRMTGVFCLGGLTQIGKVLRHAIKETKNKKVHALVFIGDCVEEDVDALSHYAGQLGLLGVPVFLFHEGNDPKAAFAFQQIAKLSNGACCPFDANSAEQLRELLRAVAVFAAGGRKALLEYGRGRAGPVASLTHQLKNNKS